MSLFLKLLAKINIDCFCQDMVPPKDPYIQVRVLDDIGEGIVLSDDKTANFAPYSMHFLKRTDAEPFISRVRCSINLINWMLLQSHTGIYWTANMFEVLWLNNRAWWRSWQADLAGSFCVITLVISFFYFFLNNVGLSVDISIIFRWSGCFQ